ncbi:chloride channel protein [Sulfurimonas lithotrophica]|uniref:Chloride channel protein n=1 Tax=Sulfurimonas lithotrophica TaxID=2590022 RepID=A0A5P8P0W4_9BACT|nr:chloride channel protein [Sulfurimonas lithotrophica]QFR49329.1 chloride channel protein [Sulfurimonas lithotrophica]
MRKNNEVSIVQKIKEHFLFHFFSQQFKEIYLTAVDANAKIKVQFYLFFPFLVASLLTGAIAYGYYEVFKYLEQLSVLMFRQNPLSIFIVTPASFLVSWWLVVTFAPFSKGSGIPQVMASIELADTKKDYLVDYFVNLKIIIVKLLSSFVKVLGGGVLGREGPTIQIASSVFIVIYKFLPSWWPQVAKRNTLIAGAASGLAAAFNTPLGGLIFAIEELSKYHVKHYQTTLFMAVIVAGLTAQGFGGSYLYLGYPKLLQDNWDIVHIVILVALLSGYFGSKMGDIIFKVLSFILEVKSKTKMIQIILLSGLAVALSIYLFGEDVMGSGKELMQKLLYEEDKTIAWYIPFVRIFNTMATFSIGGAGGIFAPSLSSGAAVGALVAQYFHILGEHANLLILVGMTSFLTGITRAPFTAAIIVFEMTDRHSAIFFLLIAAIFANLISSLVSERSFYENLKDNYIEDATKLSVSK